MRMADFLRISWSGPGDALIQPPRFSPVLADPSFLFPSETASGDWELFAHSAWGIHRYSSTDGLDWHDRGIVVRNAMRPFIRRLDLADGPAYCLLHESYRPLALPMTVLPVRPRWRSRLAASTSRDLALWSRRENLLEPDLDWMRDARLGDSLSNPCLVQAGPGDWRLYFSASLVWLPDCGFCEPRYIGMARAPSPLGPFVPEALPLIDPSIQVGGAELGAGSMKVLTLDDGYIGLQNRIYRDAAGSSRSAIFILRSGDGKAWQAVSELPLIAPSSGWMSSHVYACDCRFDAASGLWYLYFNARDGWGLSSGAKERIGRIVGRLG
jgi:hypothetical protein